MRIGSLHNFQPFSYLDRQSSSISHCYQVVVTQQQSINNKTLLVFFVSIGNSHLSFPFGPSFLLANYPQTISRSKVVNVVLLLSLFLDSVEQKKKVKKKIRKSELDKNKTRREFSRQSSQRDKFSAFLAARLQRRVF